jgi:shikimate dehydrogenase
MSMRDLMNCEIDEAQRKYVVFGSPEAQAHILTSFNTFFEQLDVPALCVPYPWKTKITGGMIATELLQTNTQGVAFDRPQALDECPVLAELNADAAAIQLVSAIHKLPDGRYAGALFDSMGLGAHLKQQGLSFEGLKVLILGAGSQSGAVALAAVQNGASHLDLMDPRQYLVEKLIVQLQGLSNAHLGESMRSDKYDVIVNTWGNQSQLPSGSLNNYFKNIQSNGWAVDTGLSLEHSSFLKTARNLGIHTFSGIPSLRRQVRYYLQFFGELGRL